MTEEKSIEDIEIYENPSTGRLSNCETAKLIKFVHLDFSVAEEKMFEEIKKLVGLVPEMERLSLNLDDHTTVGFKTTFITYKNRIIASFILRKTEFNSTELFGTIDYEKIQ